MGIGGPKDHVTRGMTGWGLFRRPVRAGKFGLGLLAMALTAAMGVASAQTFRGSIVGTVLDQTEAPVPAAKVTAKNQATGVARTTLTQDAGTFAIPELPIGAYTVTVEKEGFARAMIIRAYNFGTDHFIVDASSHSNSAITAEAQADSEEGFIVRDTSDERAG